MAYTDAGAVNTGDPTKTSWGNQVRNNQEDHEFSITTNEANIATNLSNINSNDTDISNHNGRITTLEGSVSGGWIWHHAEAYYNAAPAPGRLMFSGGIGTSSIKMHVGFNHYGGSTTFSSVVQLGVATVSPYTYYCKVAGSGNGSGGFLLVSTIHPQGLTFAITDTAFGHYFTIALGAGTFEIRLVKPAGWISNHIWMEYV